MSLLIQLIVKVTKPVFTSQDVRLKQSVKQNDLGSQPKEKSIIVKGKAIAACAELQDWIGMAKVTSAEQQGGKAKTKVNCSNQFRRKQLF